MSRLVGSSTLSSSSGGATVLKAVSSGSPLPAFDLSAFGADMASVAKAHNGGFGGTSESKFVMPTIVGGDRPGNMWFKVPDVSAYWNYYRRMDWLRGEVSILSTIIHRSSTELTRYNINWDARFVKKCMECGYESKTNLGQCPQCGSRRMRRPEDKQKDYFRRPNGRSFLEEANDNGQSLKDVIRTYAEFEYLDNQAYTVCVTGEEIDRETGQLLTDSKGRPLQFPHEFICVDPKFVRYLYDETGRPGRDYGFTMRHRDHLLTKSDEGVLTAPDGDVLYPAVWQVGSNYGGTGEYLLYTQEEVYQDKWLRPSMTYGVPVWMDIEDDLLTYHFIEKHNLKKYEYGYVRKIIILPGFSQDDAELIASGVQDVLAVNDNSIPIICLPPQVPNTPPMHAESIELGTESSSDLMQIKNDVRDRACAFVGVPNLFAGDVEASGGMNNESQQITTFDRYLTDKYDYIDRQLRWVLSFFPDITDWELHILRPSKTDIEQKKRMEAIQEAQAMKNLGFKITYVDGEFLYSEEAMDNPSSSVPLAGANQGGPFGGNTGATGPRAGNPEGDQEMFGTSEDVKDSMSEADDSATV